MNEIKCPYCRTLHPNLIPYVNLAGIKKIRGVNHPIIYTMNLSKCSFILKSGKNKGKPCSQNCNGEYCNRHIKLIEKNNNRCKHILVKGINKGKQCSKKIKENGYCSIHLK